MTPPAFSQIDATPAIIQAKQEKQIAKLGKCDSEQDAEEIVRGGRVTDAKDSAVGNDRVLIIIG